MGETQLSECLSKEDVDAIVSFLGRLEGQVPASVLQLPIHSTAPQR